NLTTYCIYDKHSRPCSLRACSRDDPECGARRGVLRRRLVTACPGRLGKSSPGTMTWMRGARCDRSGANAGEKSAAPEPKTATVERREASVPRHGTQGASLGAWPAASSAGRTGAAAPERLSALYHPSIGVIGAKVQSPG